MEEYLKIGLIQTSLDEEVAWDYDPRHPIQMHSSEENRIWDEIRKGFYNLKSEPEEDKPHIIILPELTLPIGKENDLVQIAKSMGTVVIAGLDFVENFSGVENKAVVLIPENWPNSRPSGRVRKFYFGKTFFSYDEKKYFAKKGKTEHPWTTMFILDAGSYGRIGVAICSDFFDIERFVIYKGKIHHMIVIAHNKDVRSYYFLAEAISRLVYCNVVICNTGYYGGSMVFSPYKDDYKRYIYKHEGGKLFTTQTLKIPVNQLDEAQQTGSTKIFKAQPPGYNQVRLERDVVELHL